jgi:hypothetical protein
LLLQLLVVGNEPIATQPPRLHQRLVLDLADALAADLDATSTICHRWISRFTGNTFGGEWMATIEFWARIGSDRTLTIPPEVADRIEGDEPVRIVVVLPRSDEDQDWTDTTIDQFLRGYDPSDDIYDDVPGG